VILELCWTEKEDERKCSPPVSKTGELMAISVEKVEVLSNFFASVFDDNLSFHISQAPEPQGKDWGNEDQVEDQLRNLNRDKSVGLNEKQPRVLRELANVVAKPLNS